ncbi:transposase [Cupriavidus basilensis]
MQQRSLCCVRVQVRCARATPANSVCASSPSGGWKCKWARDGRCQYDGQAKLALVQACMKAGMSIARMARGHRINANQLRIWVSRYQQRNAVGANTSNPVPLNEGLSAFILVQTEAASTIEADARGLAQWGGVRPRRSGSGRVVVGDSDTGEAAIPIRRGADGVPAPGGRGF